MAKVKKYTGDNPKELSDFPNFHKTGNTIGMREKYYGKDALLVKKENYVYNVSSEPSIYNDKAK